MCSEPYLEVLLMWWAPVGSELFGPGFVVLHGDIRENPGGKNRVMTTADMFFRDGESFSD